MGGGAGRIALVVMVYCGWGFCLTAYHPLPRQLLLDLCFFSVYCFLILSASHKDDDDERGGAVRDSEQRGSDRR